MRHNDASIEKLELRCRRHLAAFFRAPYCLGLDASSTANTHVTVLCLNFLTGKMGAKNNTYCTGLSRGLTKPTHTEHLDQVIML